MPNISAYELLSSMDIHSFCLESMPKNKPLKGLYLALLCGPSKSLSHDFNVFKDLGLYHLVVVSGAHVLALEKGRLFTFKKSPKLMQRMVIYACVSIYAGLCDWQAPITRALLRLLLHPTSKKLRLFWTPQWHLLFSGLLCLAFNPKWWPYLKPLELNKPWPRLENKNMAPS